MSVSSIMSAMRSSRVIAIDPASHSLAWAVLDLSNDGIKLVSHGKINLSKSPEMGNKLNMIKKEIGVLCEEYKPNVGVIEQSVFIQNFQSSRILSYIIGCTWGTLGDYCDIVMDVNPLSWKAGIGYKNISKNEIKAITAEHGEKGIQKRLSYERKNRVKIILEKKLPGYDYSNLDSDITDAIGIGLWYGVSNGFRTV